MLQCWQSSLSIAYSRPVIHKLQLNLQLKVQTMSSNYSENFQQMFLEIFNLRLLGANPTLAILTLSHWTQNVTTCCLKLPKTEDQSPLTGRGTTMIAKTDIRLYGSKNLITQQTSPLTIYSRMNNKNKVFSWSRIMVWLEYIPLPRTQYDCTKFTHSYYHSQKLRICTSGNLKIDMCDKSQELAECFLSDSVTYEPSPTENRFIDKGIIIILRNPKKSLESDVTNISETECNWHQKCLYFFNKALWLFNWPLFRLKKKNNDDGVHGPTFPTLAFHRSLHFKNQQFYEKVKGRQNVHSPIMFLNCPLPRCMYIKLLDSKLDAHSDRALDFFLKRHSTRHLETNKQYYYKIYLLRCSK